MILINSNAAFEDAFRSKAQFKEWLDHNFDEWPDDVTDEKFRGVIYWDFCPYDQDVGNGKRTLVWNRDDQELQEDLHNRGQEI